MQPVKVVPRNDSLLSTLRPMRLELEFPWSEAIVLDGLDLASNHDLVTTEIPARLGVDPGDARKHFEDL